MKLVSGRVVPPDDREQCCFKCCVTIRGMPLIISLNRKRLMLCVVAHVCNPRITEAGRL